MHVYHAPTVRKTIRVIFANCPHLDESAAAYLVLAQNSVQNVLEFEVWHLYSYGEVQGLRNWRTSLLGWWSELGIPTPWKRVAARHYRAEVDRLVMPPLRKKLPRQTCVSSVRPFLIKNDEWIRSLPPGTYGNWTIKQAPTVIVTESVLEDGYVGWSDGDVSIACIGEWRKRQTPPSLLEFILDQVVQPYGLRLAVNDRVSSHHPTRACVWDFDANIADARLSPLVGYLCDSCEALIAERVSANELTEIRHLLSHKWIGRMEDPGTVASNLKRVFGYDLASTRGLSAGFWDSLRVAVPVEFVKFLAAVITGVVLTLATLWLKGKP